MNISILKKDCIRSKTNQMRQIQHIVNSKNANESTPRSNRGAPELKTLRVSSSNLLLFFIIYTSLIPRVFRLQILAIDDQNRLMAVMLSIVHQIPCHSAQFYSRITIIAQNQLPN